MLLIVDLQCDLSWTKLCNGNTHIMTERCHSVPVLLFNCHLSAVINADNDVSEINISVVNIGRSIYQSD